ncbi:NUDIX domain-containing protein [Candidatus Woesebacteria bacterium]|nr:NUDIX domain-containing protein [Candidatus Woesebacteria bacterium]
MKDMVRHQLTEQVKLLQKIVIIHENKVLILKRSSESTSRSNKWDLPGGNAEWPDASQDLQNPHNADMAREVFEETGITCESQVTKTISVGSHFDAQKQVYTIIVGFCMQLPPEIHEHDILLSDEHTDFAWATREQLAEYDFGFAGAPDGFIFQMITKALA